MQTLALIHGKIQKMIKVTEKQSLIYGQIRTSQNFRLASKILDNSSIVLVYSLDETQIYTLSQGSQSLNQKWKEYLRHLNDNSVDFYITSLLTLFKQRIQIFNGVDGIMIIVLLQGLFQQCISTKMERRSIKTRLKTVYTVFLR